MILDIHHRQLPLAYPWKIASGENSTERGVVIVELTDRDGVVGLGEAAPAANSGETPLSIVQAYAAGVDLRVLSFDDIAGSMDKIGLLPPVARCGLNTALADGAAKRAGRALYDFCNLGFRETYHVTSFSIGIDSPEIIREKVLAAANYPVLKLKVGDARDRENLAALRTVAPHKPVRVDANEGWETKEQALEMIEWLATDGHIQFVEQPLPRSLNQEDFIWLKERSPLLLFADESCRTERDIPFCAECFHGVNVKLAKTGGMTTAYETLQAARQAGLKTMIGCMIETSVLISAAAHLAELADFLDLDGNLLITDDPYAGVTAENGVLSFAKAKEKFGLRVTPR
jgi:L-alanine-DL-glutamate epimerase-like enolase superfamily enzyme